MKDVALAKAIEAARPHVRLVPEQKSEQAAPASEPAASAAAAAFAAALQASGAAEHQRQTEVLGKFVELGEQVAAAHAALGAAIELLKKEGPAPATASDIAGVVNAAAALFASRLAANEARIDRVLQWLDVLSQQQVAILEAQYKDVIPEYDSAGRVVRASRKP